MNFHILLFDDFETLDAFGPAEIAGQMPDEMRLDYRSMDGGRAIGNKLAFGFAAH